MSSSGCSRHTGPVPTHSYSCGSKSLRWSSIAVTRSLSTSTPDSLMLVTISTPFCSSDLRKGLTTDASAESRVSHWRASPAGRQ